MQACKLSIGEAHPSQVVKAELDVPSQRAALLLLDSSCLLFSSLSGNHSPPSLVPPSCTDICFLRLRQRSSNLFSSSSEKSAEAATRSDLKTLANGKGKISMAVEEKVGDAMPGAGSVNNSMARAGSVGEAMAESGDGTLVFLTLKPAKGGFCTDLMAWRCSGLSFLQTPICLEGCRSFSPPAALARFDDIPHGISVGIAASINVVVVHSPAVGKVWILSAKLSDAEHDNTRNPRSELTDEYVKNPMLKDTVKSTSKGDIKQQGKERRGCLHLIKCSVVDCNGPVYALHLSLQHLLVGQLGGVRVWTLRPLIKGSVVKRKELKADPHCRGRGRCTNACGTRQEGTKFSQGKEFGKKILDAQRGLNGQDLITFEGNECGRTLKEPGLILTRPKNGFYEVAVVGNGIMNVKINSKLVTKTAYLDGLNNGQGDIGIKDQGYDWSGKPLEQILCNSNGEWQHVGATQKRTGASDLQQDIANASKIVQLEPAATIAVYKNGVLPFEFDLEELLSQLKLSQSSLFSSSSSSSSSVHASYGARAVTGAQSSSFHSLTSSLSSIAGVSETTGALNKTAFAKGTQDGVFVPFQKQMLPKKTSQLLTGLAKGEQVASIHGLSEREFVILDSLGKLHLLTLQYSVRGDEARLQRASRVSVNASLQPMMCAMKIKMLTVLPVLHSGQWNSCSVASRILWISDGGHTIYIVRLPAQGNSKEGSGKSLLGLTSNPTVIQSVFTTDRICSLSALSLNRVMVLTEGSMLAYSLNGT